MQRYPETCRLEPTFSYLSKKKVANMLLKPFKDEKEAVAVILLVRALTSSYWNRKG